MDQNGLHPLLPGMTPAMIQSRPQEALRLAGTHSGSDDGGAPAVRRCGIKPLVGDALMAIGREAEWDCRERLAAFRGELRREGDGDVGAFDEALRLGEEVVEHGGERGVGGAEARGEEIVQGTGDLVGYGGGDHWWWASRLLTAVGGWSHSLDGTGCRLLCSRLKHGPGGVLFPFAIKGLDD